MAITIDTSIESNGVNKSKNNNYLIHNYTKQNQQLPHKKCILFQIQNDSIKASLEYNKNCIILHFFLTQAPKL